MAHLLGVLGLVGRMGSGGCGGLGFAGWLSQFWPDKVPVGGAQVFSANRTGRLALNDHAKCGAGYATILLNGKLGEVDGGHPDARGEFRHAASRKSVKVWAKLHLGMHIAQLFPKHSAYQ